MLREVLKFIHSLWDEWKTLLTGGTICAGLVLWQYLNGKPLWSHTGWVFVGITLIMASFFSWRKQWKRAETNFFPLSPAALIKLREGKTSPHADTILRPYIGRRVKITGNFYDVSPIGFGLKMVHLRCEKILISTKLPFWRAKEFVPLPLDALITVTGTITEIGSMGISISNIELVPNPLVVTDEPPLLSEAPA